MSTISDLRAIFLTGIFNLRILPFQSLTVGLLSLLIIIRMAFIRLGKRVQMLRRLNFSCKGYRRIFVQRLFSYLDSCELISLSHAMRPGLQIRHFWVAKSLFLTITVNQKKQDKTFCF